MAEGDDVPSLAATVHSAYHLGAIRQLAKAIREAS